MRLARGAANPPPRAPNAWRSPPPAASLLDAPDDARLDVREPHDVEDVVDDAPDPPRGHAGVVAQRGGELELLPHRKVLEDDVVLPEGGGTQGTQSNRKARTHRRRLKHRQTGTETETNVHGPLWELGPRCMDAWFFLPLAA